MKVEHNEAMGSISHISDEGVLSGDVNTLPATETLVKKNNNQNEEHRPVCFVIMPYGKWHDRYYQEIYISAIRAAGYQPERADDIFGPQEVMRDVWNSTKKANAMIADLTGWNPNVFYELGIAHAIQKNVIMVTDSEDRVPFDLRGLRTIYYDKNDPDWAKALRDNIQCMLEELKKSPTSQGLVPHVFLDRSGLPFNNNDTLDESIRRALGDRKLIRNLRIFAHSSSNIYHPMHEALSSNLKILRCQIILRKFNEEQLKAGLNSREGIENFEIRKAIEQWKKQKNNIEQLQFYGYGFELSEYQIIIDDDVLISGIYVPDEKRISGINYESLLYVEKSDEYNKFIQNFIQRFDSMTKNLKSYDR